ncbi:chorismate pyruvate-lyase family protein [Methanosarcina sp. Z-7115]|uniref:Chorismate pyruvate-lyase family protein n=1 Tax=Methanosarcina baikalica TaxID=3073890 RepID=A0ABU2CZS7_9EURY|nr:chorismate pyruvate-lyase family protein [Methanosarcina sp. Z-7115]MDR7665213.1 chorismate pyruvate-lyase family protein [Methanosarcina sp. Z-7115]
MSIDFLEKLKSFEIPTCLRVCCGTDGSVTFLLEIMTRKPVSVITESQYTVKADKEMATFLGVEEGSEINNRVVRLSAGGTVFVHARSLSPLERMPETMKEQLMRADIPIGRILRSHNLETRRDMGELEVLEGEPTFDGIPVLSRSYKIVHNNHILMWINERFPIDERWNL